MPKRQIGFDPEAVAEAQAAVRWYRRRNPVAAEAFLAELDRAIRRIEDSPGRWPAHIEGTRRFLLRRFPFAIVYRLRRRSIDVLAVAHAKRRPGYWRTRHRSEP